MFMDMHGLAFGLTSTVVTFNRFPMLITVVTRHMFGVLVGAYFDDMPVLYVSSGATSGTSAVLDILSLVGSPPSSDKVFPVLGQPGSSWGLKSG